eukprot:m.113627 g.113627  ORF g.113627 m.113627 type:complete len:180 (-) comp28285_c0_seq1:88-627(-)
MNTLDTDYALNSAATTIQALWRGHCVRRCITIARSQFIEVVAAIEGKEQNQLQEELTWSPSFLSPPIFRQCENTCSVNDVVNATPHLQPVNPENVGVPTSSHAREGADTSSANISAEGGNIFVPNHLETPLARPLEPPTKAELLAKQENLLFELTWTSQAIKSREQYLILKHHLAQEQQ